METYLWVCIILFLAGFTQGVAGFGSVLLSIPLLVIYLDIKTVIPLAALVCLSITLMLLIQLRHHFDWKKVYPLLIGAIPGIPVGVFFLKKLEVSVIHWVLGVILIAYSLYSLLSRPSEKGIRNAWAYPFGFLAGCVGGALGAAAPPVIVYISMKGWAKDQIKATLQGFLVISGLTVVFFHAISGLTTLMVLRFFGIALPMLILGTYIGTLFYGIIKEDQYRKVILALIAFLGAFMIYRAHL